MEQTLTATLKTSPVGEENLPALGRKFFIVLAIYFIIQVILRLITSNSADLDDSEQLVFTQQFQWGYGPQPPLYTWLQILFFKIFTPSILGLSLLKNLLLFGTYAFTYLNARLITRSHGLGIAAAASLLFIPQIAWESQRDLTHTVLATTLATIAFHFFLRLREKSSATNYFFFGASCGFGLLANYNFGAFLLGLLIAAATLPSFRRLIFSLKIYLAVAVCALIILPHVIWAANNFDTVAATSHKFKIQSDKFSLGVLFLGVKNLLAAVGAHIGALIGIIGLLALTSRHSPAEKTSDHESCKLILREVFIVVAVLACGIVMLKITGFRDRWFQPVFVCLPVALVVLFRQQLGKKQIRAIFALASLVAVFVCIAMPARIWFAEKLHRHEQLIAPFDKFSGDIRTLFPQMNLFVAEDFWIGGNLRLHLPRSKILTPHLPKTWRREIAPEDCLLVWDATREKKHSDAALNFAGPFAETDVTGASSIEETLKYFHSKKMRLGIVVEKTKSPNDSH